MLHGEMNDRRDTRTAAGSYGSARDLPIAQELTRQLDGMRRLTRFVARDQRETVRRLEEDLAALTQLVDDFYATLGPRNWIFHERLSTKRIAELVGSPADEAEQALIAVYRDPDALNGMLRTLNRFSALQARMELIDKARSDYEHDRFYATVLVLLAVMDGFVNDLEPEHRRGLHAREPSELTAWNSVVGHHLGLTNAHASFTKGAYKLSSEPVYELQRHGIVHGTLVNFDNVVVATKAWNRLFAVADWAAARVRQQEPAEPEPRLRDVLAQMRDNARNRAALEAWQPSILTPRDPGFGDHELTQRTIRYLDGWTHRNYGAMAQLLSPAVAQESVGATAGILRLGYEFHQLAEYTVIRVAFEAAAVGEVDVELRFDDGVRPGRMRWIREAPDGSPAMPGADGQWHLCLWGPEAILNRAEPT